MCEFNKYKDEILWCIPMNSPCIKCVDKYPKIYEKIKKIANGESENNTISKQELNNG